MADNLIMRLNQEGQAGRKRKAQDHGPVDPAHPLPNRAEDITLELLDRLVSEMHPRSSVTGFELVEAMGLQHQVSTAGRARLRLQYGPGSADLPEQVIVKMVIEEPGVDSALYETESQMYREVLPKLDIPQVRCLGAAYEGESERFILLLEDLTPRQPFFPHAKEKPLTPEQVAALLSQLARLHARYWNSPRLEEMEHRWLSSLLSGRQFDFFEALVAPGIEALAADSPYRQDLIARTGWTPRQLWAGVKAAHAYHFKIFPPTLVHGDTGAHNTWHLADGSFGFLDWQISARGTWAHDVHYLMIESLSIAERRANERALVGHYLAELARNGVNDLPDIETAMQGYGRAIIWGFAIGWLLCPERNYPMEIITTNLERLYAAMCDHDTLRLVEEATRAL
ncbi:MAG: phosphotransferase [Candidatus Binatia bacterium]